MPSSDDEGEDVFFDASDYIRNSIDSVSSGDNFAESRELEFKRFQYELWSTELRSIEERRKRFLQGMGFDNEFMFSQTDNGEETEQRVHDNLMDHVEIERIAESSSVVPDTLLVDDDREHMNCYLCIRDLDTGKKFIVHDIGPDGVLRVLKEVGSDRTMTLQEFEAFLGISSPVQQFMRREPTVSSKKQNEGAEVKRKKSRSWWRGLKWNRHLVGMCKHDDSVQNVQQPKTSRIKVQQQKKRCMEFTALYLGQEIKGHNGLIRTMKFSVSGRHLASGGEDCVVRIWQVREVETSSKCFASNGSSKFINKIKDGRVMFGRKSPSSAPAVIPKELFKIEETPLHEFHGHTSGILDLSWSESDFLLTSSKDKTVRLWKVGCDLCLKVFQHNDYVTCIQFNPVDERYFISGCIDGKVRVWGVSENRVVDWADTRDIVTAICYRPDGKGFVVGSIAGGCHFYNYSGSSMKLDTRLCVDGRRQSTGKRITCLQFSPCDSKKVMVSSADAKIRIFDGVEVIHKFKGLRKSKSQSSASFTSDGRYIVSVDEESHVYIWNYNEPNITSLNGAKTIRSFEFFSSEGVSVALPWSGINRRVGLDCNDILASSTPRKILEPLTWLRNPDCFSLGVWFFADSLSRGSATWPEEKLLTPAEPSTPTDNHQHDHIQQSDLQNQLRYLTTLTLSATWNLVIVTASHDGSIRSFHNFGLPVRL
ncbi:WD40-repeat-containing domain-containing protein [Dioscorea alata]|uniref:WD40-repeat-containing domain-containing protein n=1 Tax=Dioscorea alata TaxID=55571 RepID=A0ACB7VC02_DIOAL|nr:WD40-repeat-containing domain-containing protein [Dioscorea alata]